MTSTTKRQHWRVLVVILAAALALALLPGAAPGEAIDDEIDGADDEKALVTLSIPDRATLDVLADQGYDLDHNVEAAGSGFTVSAVVKDSQRTAIEQLGVGIDVEATGSEVNALRESMVAERQATLDANSALAAELELEEIDTVVIARADYFTSEGEEYISVEAKTSDGEDVDLTIAWDAGPGTDFGDGGTAELNDFTDADQYLYHRGQFQLGGRAELTIADGAAAGGYTAVGSSFGPALDTTGVTGTVELVNDDSDDPTEGCDPLVGFTAGNIALFDRGSCPFTDKVENAEAAGAIAAIVANSNSGAPFAMTGNSDTEIPSAMIGEDDGATIKSGLPAAGTIALLPPLPPPTKVLVTSENGGSAEAEFTEWLATDFPERPHRYFQGFLQNYGQAIEYTEIIEEMAADFPELTELIDLPNLTNGYRRQAMHLTGDDQDQRVGATSHAWGHEGGNDLTIAYVDPGAADSALAVSVSGNDISVSLATDGDGALISTAADVVAAINGNADASALVEAYTYRGNDGDGIVAAQDAESFSDELDAPADVPREPFQVKMLRICT
ncbi:PA domain-containing protein, partial [Ilumatobacter sp.]|uniref:PA domain-containing protein n=1 Tax=Ilumatobacter sp. TaxID=1967498 RepID=UPI003C34E8FA